MSGEDVALTDGAQLFVKLLGVDGKSKPLLNVLHGAPGLSNREDPEPYSVFLQPQFHDKAWVGDEKFILVGGSYEGLVAPQYVLKFPARVTTLITRGTWNRGPLSTLAILKTILMSERIEPDPDRQLRCWSRNLLDDEDFTQAYLEIVPMFAAESPDREGPAPLSFEAKKAFSSLENIYAATQNFAFSYNVTKFDVRSKLKDIEVPTLSFVDVATWSFLSKRGKSWSMVSLIQLAIFEHWGHGPSLDESWAFQERVWEFLAPFQ
ncbi:putative Alpha/beta hydrolase fold protein [Seiridium cardinale]